MLSACLALLLVSGKPAAAWDWQSSFSDLPTNVSSWWSSSDFSGWHWPWQTAECVQPALPAAPTAADADALKAYIASYNDYAAGLQGYLNCLSAKAQHDANAASNNAVSSAQSMYDAAKKKAAELGASVEESQPGQ